ncbi:AMP-binding protein [Streptomyces laurentii]|uniref:AMP-binding protein n=1 Tax=Streptomyces laurentii TaxID=39478 RepID=UPI0033EEF733
MILRSPLPDVVLPDVTVYELLFGALDDGDRERDALVDGITGRTLTYGELAESVDRFAGALAARGLRPGDVVGLNAPNSSSVRGGQPRAGRFQRVPSGMYRTYALPSVSRV